MKRLLIAALLIPALASTAVIVTDVPGTHDLFSGSRKLGAYLTHAECVNAAKLRNIAAKYTCRNSSTVTVATTPDPVPPPPPPASSPASAPLPTSMTAMLYGGVRLDAATFPTPYTGRASDYAMPAMIDGLAGTVVPYEALVVYYSKTSTQAIPDTAIKEPPEGLRMVGGDSTRVAKQDAGPTYFQCLDSTVRYPTLTELVADGTCATSGRFWHVVIFPRCWNGVDLDSPDHRAHMAYADPALGCSSSFPVAIPAAALKILYKVPPTIEGVMAWRLSSDAQNGAPGASSFADWLVTRHR